MAENYRINWNSSIYRKKPPFITAHNLLRPTQQPSKVTYQLIHLMDTNLTTRDRYASIWWINRKNNKLKDTVIFNNKFHQNSYLGIKSRENETKLAKTLKSLPSPSKYLWESKWSALKLRASNWAKQKQWPCGTEASSRRSSSIPPETFNTFHNG